MFDAAIAVTPNRLAGIVLEPLSPALVADHKAVVIEAFCAQSARNKALVKSKHAYWCKTIPVTAPHALKGDLGRFSAPPPVRKLAQRIKREIPESEFAVQFFYEDPILEVTVDGEVHYLAIWDGQVIAIAQTTPQRRWFHWFRSSGR